MKRSIQIVALLLTLVPFYGDVVPSYAQAPNQGPSATNVTGEWSGTTRVIPCDFTSPGRCNAINNITFRFDQHGNKVAGRYTCAYGNLICRNGGADNTGKIVSGRISGNQLRLSVVIPADVSNCYYNGALTSPTTARGGYSCYEGGELVEEGVWALKRASVQPAGAER